MAAGRGRRWVRRLIHGVGAIALITAVAFGLRGPQGFSTLLEKRRELQRLQEENATLMKEIEEKRERIKRLREDPTFQDEVIRRHLKRAKPGEKTLIYPTTPAR